MNVSANTHFEEWWFKTFLDSLRQRRLIHSKDRTVSIWRLFFCDVQNQLASVAVFERG